MNEIERYAGLTISDKPALLEAKSTGYRTTHLWSNGLRYLVNIDVALAQIAEMESAEKPMTWNERINQMTVEEKAKWMSERGYCPENFLDCDMYEDCKACWKAVLASPYSPYTEGEQTND